MREAGIPTAVITNLNARMHRNSQFQTANQGNQQLNKDTLLEKTGKVLGSEMAYNSIMGASVIDPAFTSKIMERYNAEEREME